MCGFLFILTSSMDIDREGVFEKVRLLPAEVDLIPKPG
jgi:hypothetical protein